MGEKSILLKANYTLLKRTFLKANSNVSRVAKSRDN